MELKDPQKQKPPNSRGSCRCLWQREGWILHLRPKTSQKDRITESLHGSDLITAPKGLSRSQTTAGIMIKMAAVSGRGHAHIWRNRASAGRVFTVDTCLSQHEVQQGKQETGKRSRILLSRLQKGPGACGRGRGCDCCRQSVSCCPETDATAPRPRPQRAGDVLRAPTQVRENVTEQTRAHICRPRLQTPHLERGQMSPVWRETAQKPPGPRPAAVVWYRFCSDRASSAARRAQMRRGSSLKPATGPRYPTGNQAQRHR